MFPALGWARQGAQTSDNVHTALYSTQNDPGAQHASPLSPFSLTALAWPAGAGGGRGGATDGSSAWRMAPGRTTAHHSFGISSVGMLGC